MDSEGGASAALFISLTDLSCRDAFSVAEIARRSIENGTPKADFLHGFQ